MGKSGFRHGPRKTNRERGAAAVEFALVFIVFFMVLYGIISYGIIFAIRHSLTQAANEGARAAVRDVGGLVDRMLLAQATAANAVSWLGVRAPVPEVTEVTSPSCPGRPFTCVKVALIYDYAANPIVPPMPGLGLTLPGRIAAQATVQLAAIY